jgi:hypothetical protein
MKNFLFILFSAFLLSSCVSSKYFYEHYSDISHVDNLQKLEGTYGNKPINDVGFDNNYSSLEKIIFNPFHINTWNEKRDFSGEIRIKVLSDNKIEVSHIDNGMILKTKELKGKIVNNYFEVNTRRRFIGFPFTYFKMDVEKLQLGVSENGSLIASNGRYHFGSIFIIFGDSTPSVPLSYFERK